MLPPSLPTVRPITHTGVFLVVWSTAVFHDDVTGLHLPVHLQSSLYSRQRCQRWSQSMRRRRLASSRSGSETSSHVSISLGPIIDIVRERFRSHLPVLCRGSRTRALPNQRSVLSDQRFGWKLGSSHRAFAPHRRARLRASSRLRRKLGSAPPNLFRTQTCGAWTWHACHASYVDAGGRGGAHRSTTDDRTDRRPRDVVETNSTMESVDIDKRKEFEELQSGFVEVSNKMGQVRRKECDDATRRTNERCADQVVLDGYVPRSSSSSSNCASKTASDKEPSSPKLNWKDCRMT